MLAILAAIGFALGILFKLFSRHENWVIWLALVSGLLLALHCCAYGRTWYRWGPGPRA